MAQNIGFNKFAQRLLNQHGARLKVDGKFGDVSRIALRDFQRARGLPETGTVTPETLAALKQPPSPRNVPTPRLRPQPMPMAPQAIPQTNPASPPMAAPMPSSQMPPAAQMMPAAGPSAAGPPRPAASLPPDWAARRQQMAELRQRTIAGASPQMQTAMGRPPQPGQPAQVSQDQFSERFDPLLHGSEPPGGLPQAVLPAPRPPMPTFSERFDPTAPIGEGTSGENFTPGGPMPPTGPDFDQANPVPPSSQQQALERRAAEEALNRELWEMLIGAMTTKPPKRTIPPRERSGTDL